MPMGIMLLVLAELRRLPLHEWHPSLARILDHVSGTQMLSTSVHSLATSIPAVGSVWPFAPGFCTLAFPILMLAWTLELCARVSPLSLKMLLLECLTAAAAE